MMEIRVAAPEDASELVKVYAPYVTDTAVTFEYEIPGIEEMKRRVRETLKRYPYLVVEEAGNILGYAYASPFKARAAYMWSVETSVYLRHDMRSRGIGSVLYGELERQLRRQNVCNLCACITYPNPESIGFHKKLGYKTVAHFSSAGFKSGAWHDIVWMEKELCPHSIPPLPFLPFPEQGKQNDIATVQPWHS